MSAQSVPGNKSRSEDAAAALKAMGTSPEGEEDEVDEGPVDLDDDDDEPNGAASTSQKDENVDLAGKKRKKKKSKGSKGKGKAAVERLKSALALGGDKDKDSANKELTPISDELYERIVSEAKKKAGPEEAAKLDRQSVMELVECELRGPATRWSSLLIRIPCLTAAALKLRDVITGKSSGIDATGRNKKWAASGHLRTALIIRLL